MKYTSEILYLFWVRNMGRDFIPTLIETITWSPYYWDSLETELSKDIRDLISKKDVDGIYEKIKGDLENYSKDEVKRRIKDFIDDVTSAGGVVAIRDKVYQEVVLAILDR